MNRDIAILSGYGAFELKKSYRKNLLIGIITACILHLTVIGSVIIIKRLAYNPSIEKDTKTIDIQQLRVPQITIGDIAKQISVLPRSSIIAGVPIAVPEEQAPVETDFPTQRELGIMVALQPLINLEDNNVEIVFRNPEELLPSPDEFVAYEEAPEKIENVKPVYPEMARRAGIEGTVWIKALIDKEGRVRDVRIAIDSNTNAGFEEAAIEAAMKTVWKPAISNGQPIAVWITYRIIFTLTGAQ